MANDKPSKILASTKGPGVSYLNLFNPLSAVMGGGDRYPEFMAKMFPGKPTAAWLVSKVGAVGFLAAILAGGIRLAQHVDTVDKISEEDNPAKKLKSQISTTFAVPLNAKTAALDGPKQSLEFPSITDTTANVRNAGLPLAVALLIAGASWDMADKWADKKRNDLMTKAIAGKSNTARRLMKLRARIARGLADEKEVNSTLASIGNDENYVKTASSNDEYPVARPIITSALLILAGLGVMTAIGSYKYSKASNINNLRYNAIKRGLKDYARNKSYASPVSIIPQDADQYFKDMYAEDGQKTRAPRDEEDAAQPNTQIKVTL